MKNSVLAIGAGIKGKPGTAYHSEDDLAVSHQIVKSRHSNSTNGLQRLAARHGAIGVQQTQGLLRSQVPLQIVGHSQAHGPEAILC